MKNKKQSPTLDEVLSIEIPESFDPVPKAEAVNQATAKRFMRAVKEFHDKAPNGDFEIDSATLAEYFNGVEGVAFARYRIWLAEQEVKEHLHGLVAEATEKFSKTGNKDDLPEPAKALIRAVIEGTEIAFNRVYGNVPREPLEVTASLTEKLAEFGTPVKEDEEDK